MGLIQYLSVFVFSLTIILGLIVLSHSPKNKLNIVFSILSFCFSLWMFCNILIDISIHDHDLIFWGKLSIIGPIIMQPLFIYFFSNFPVRNEKNYKTEKVILFASIITAAIEASLSYTAFNIRGVSMVNGMAEYQVGNLYIIFFSHVLINLIFTIYIILKKIKLLSKEERKLLFFILIGIVISIISGASTALLLIFLNIHGLSVIGPLVSVSIMLLTAYAIIRDKIFNIRLVATEILILIILSILSLGMLFSRNNAEFILIFFIFFLIVVFGYFLIRTTILEVKRKKQIQELADQLKIANQELTKLHELKDDFFQLAAHEINTPMASILGYLSMILDEKIVTIDEKAENYLKQVYSSSKRLANVVTNFLDIIKIEAGKIKLDLEKIHVCGIIKEVVDEYEEKAKEKNNYLIFDKKCSSGNEAIEISVDKNKLKEVFVNIIDNAIKFTRNGFIKITCQKKENKLFITIEDSGDGICEDDLSHIFDKFYQAQDADGHKNNGTGLGLYIAKSIIEMHDGSITAESTIGKGTKFTIMLKKDI